jgi:hypothetical protein
LRTPQSTAGVRFPTGSAIKAPLSPAIGIVIAVLATAETLPSMATAIGFGTDELPADGREDAAGQRRSTNPQQILSERLAAVLGLGFLAR